MKNTLFALILLICSSTAFSQENKNVKDDSPSKNSVYVELLGSAMTYSINYDRLLWNKNKFSVYGRLGLTYTPILKNFTPQQGPGVNVELGGLHGKHKHHFEYGVGTCYNYLSGNDERYSLLFTSLRVGYRYQKKEGGFMYRVGFTPLIPINVDRNIEGIEPGIVPYGGISLGYTF